MTDNFNFTHFINKDKGYKRISVNQALQIVLLLFITFPLLAFATSHWQKDDYITDSFIEIALKHEYSNNKNVKFSRWKEPIKVFIKSESEKFPLPRDMYQVQAKHLQKITGHPISFVQSESQANTIVVLTSAKQFKNDLLQYIKVNNFESAFANALCLATFQTNSEHEIIRGYIFVPLDTVMQRGRLADCVIEELTQMMGLVNDSDSVFPSIFNDHSIDRYLSCLDYLLLKIAYHPELKAGMTESQIREKIPSILSQLRKSGDIENAQWRVLDDSMEKWVRR